MTTLQRTASDQNHDYEAAACAHEAIRDALGCASPIVVEWIEAYLEGIASSRSPNDVLDAIRDLSQNFKLPTQEHPGSSWRADYVQGQLFE